MAKKKEDKTNVMRVLEQKGISYTAHTYPEDGPIDGVSVATRMIEALAGAGLRTSKINGYAFPNEK